jgi:hypothetical protein
VLINAIRGGLALLTWQTDTFACAEGFDETAGRYRGLRGGQQVAVTQDSGDLLVKPEVARRQLEMETPAKPAEGRPGEPAAGGGTSTAGPGQAGTPPKAGPPEVVKPKRFHGNVTLYPIRVGLDASRVADEVIAHLTALPNATVKVTLEIEAVIPEGSPDSVVRTVTENSRTLKFSSQGFETE